jgi:hypothetical protein
VLREEPSLQPDGVGGLDRPGNGILAILPTVSVYGFIKQNGAAG